MQVRIKNSSHKYSAKTSETIWLQHSWSLFPGDCSSAIFIECVNTSPQSREEEIIPGQLAHNHQCTINSWWWITLILTENCSMHRTQLLPTAVCILLLKYKINIFFCYSDVSVCLQSASQIKMDRKMQNWNGSKVNKYSGKINILILKGEVK